ncbi:Dyp-type peroxidase [Streptomyces sp. AV19]|uniref:Dyp-type peroxidase n=1 Tax=Streptomyces sp. AV19 TaxID=2793068 RepID=UPI0018FE3035|nr:Dyp-type peroxidase [Streptomyces sp. AV19]MBH1936634.1 Dyp-type peroxidase [Streptomyces sp. AV19]MDG4532695.1 Dyp-type peroxidase [Streptomyces sp. AV19]
MANDLALRESTEIQGDIVAGFKKDHVRFLLINFGEPQAARDWLARTAPLIATTKKVADFNAQYSQARKSSGGDNPKSLKATWLGLGLTYPGLQFLTGRDDLLNAGGEGRDEDTLGAFVRGPGDPAKALRLGDTDDSDPTHWDFGSPYRTEIHAVLTIAADDPNDLDSALGEQQLALSRANASVVFVQEGQHLHGDAEGKEHFGFIDGTSQPAVAGFDEPEPGKEHYAKGKPGTRLIPAGEFVIGLPGAPKHSPATAARDRMPSWMGNGSFKVLRRLEQDVPGWWNQVSMHLRRLKDLKAITGDKSQDWLAARYVGRWRDGTPVTLSPDSPDPSVPADDFDYRTECLGKPGCTENGDEDGLITPLFSHTRKSNPRAGLVEGGLIPEDLIDTARIIRRGIPYGQPFDPMSNDSAKGPDGKRGLAFVCYQSDLVGQFEFIQHDWINETDFPPKPEGHKPGPDAMVSGQLKGVNEGKASFECRNNAGIRQAVPLDFKPFVRTRGAVYAFVPSISTLRRLALGDPEAKLPEELTQPDQQGQVPPQPVPGQSVPVDAVLPVPDAKDRFWTFQQGTIRVVQIGTAERGSLTTGDDTRTGVVVDTVGPLSAWPALEGVAQLDTVLPIPDEQRSGGKSAYWVFHTLNGSQYYRYITIKDSAPYTTAKAGDDQMMVFKWSSLNSANRVDAFLPDPSCQPGPDGSYHYWAFVAPDGPGNQRYQRIAIAPVGKQHGDKLVGDANRMLTDWNPALQGVTRVEAIQAVPGKKNWYWVFHENQYRVITAEPGETPEPDLIRDDRQTAPWSRKP